MTKTWSKQIGGLVAAVLRAAERWRTIRITERGQMAAAESYLTDPGDLRRMSVVRMVAADRLG